jgi:hypothetical protein
MEDESIYQNHITSLLSLDFFPLVCECCCRGPIGRSSVPENDVSCYEVDTL